MKELYFHREGSFESKVSAYKGVPGKDLLIVSDTSYKREDDYWVFISDSGEAELFIDNILIWGIVSLSLEHIEKKDPSGTETGVFIDGVSGKVLIRPNVKEVLEDAL